MLIETLKQLDIQLLLLINGSHTPLLDKLLYWCSNLLFWMPFAAVAIGFLIKKYKSKTWVILLFCGLSILLTDQSANFIKKSVERYRPSHNIELQDQLHLHTSDSGKIYRGGNFGFVSGHAANSFGLMIFLIFIFVPISKHAWWIFPSWAMLFSYSRIYLGVHYPSDILAGAILGICYGLMITFLYKYTFIIIKKKTRKKIIHKKSLTSTNTYLSERIKSHKKTKDFLVPLSVVYTDFQTNGRGQQKHKWESEKGKNLLMSVLLYPNLSPSEQFLITEWISLSITDFLIDTLHLKEITIKWPNDIYVKDKKIAGILIEHSIEGTKINYSMAGIGLNINQEIFPDYIPNPTSIKLETATKYPIKKAMNKIMENLQTYITESPIFVHEKYISRLYKRNTFAKFHILENEEPIDMKIIHVLPSGLLQTQSREGKIMTFNYNQIQYIST